MTTKLLTAVLGLVAMMTIVGNVSAGLITGVTIEDFSSEFSPDRLAINKVNGSGLETDGGGTYHTTTRGTHWMGADDAPWSITFDLESNCNLDSFHVWNYNRVFGLPSDRSANEVQISITDTVGGSWTILDSDSGTGGLQNFSFAQTGESKTYGETFDLSAAGAANVRLVRFDILSNHSGGTDVNAGLGEVQFDGVVVPEPSSIVLILSAGVSALFFRRLNGHSSAARS